MDERRFVEFRFNDISREITGTALRYGVSSLIHGKFQERFLVGAFGDLSKADVILNEMHQREKPLARTGHGLELLDSATELRIKSNLPNTARGNDVATLIKEGVYQGLSIEFRAKKDHLSQDGIRVVESALLTGIAICDRPAHTQSQIDRMEARWKELRPIHPRRRWYV